MSRLAHTDPRLWPPCCAGGAAASQTHAPAPDHKHYDRPARLRRSRRPPARHVAPRLQNLGVHTFPVTTVDRGAAVHQPGPEPGLCVQSRRGGRAFAEAARLDPERRDGLLGPRARARPEHQRADDADDEPKAFELAQKAVALKSKVSPRERAYIDALAVRYTGKAEDRQKADQAYVAAMGRLVEALSGRSRRAGRCTPKPLMDLRPWSYWTRDGLPARRARARSSRRSSG